MTAGAVLRRRSVKIALDSALLVGFLVEVATRERSFDADYVVHGFTGVALVGVVAVHLIGNRPWIASVRRAGRAHREARLATVNLAFGTLAAVCVLSGFPLWFSWTDADVVAALHAGTGFLAAVSMVVHLVMNRRRIRALARRSTPRAEPAG